VLRGERLPGWDRVFTFYNQSSGRNWLLMRCLRTRDRSYIWNAWSDGKVQYRAENMNGLTWLAMVKGAETNPAIKERVNFYLYRTPEEFYDMTGDRYERHNLIADPSRQTEIAAMRQELLGLLQRTGDPLAPALAQRDRPEVLAAIKQQLKDEYDLPPRQNAGKKAGKKAKTASAPKKSNDLIALVLPNTVAAGQPVTLQIRYHLPADAGTQALTVTLKDDANVRLQRKVVQAEEDGALALTFDVPASLAGKSIRFAAFVGEDFTQTPQQIQSQALPVR
jgi:hypothetical protein